MKSIHLALFIIIVILSSCTISLDEEINYREKYISPDLYEMVYETGDWEHPNYREPFESFGNHRIIVELDEPYSGLVQVIVPWRRRDNNPQDKEIVVIDANTNKIVKNKYGLEINNERGHIIFEANEKSTQYFIYYFPYQSTGGYYPKVNYIAAKEQSQDDWLTKNKITIDQIQDLPSVRIVSAQSIDEFHSFFPMEIIATKDEESKYFKDYPQPYYLFPEYRGRPIKMQDYLPLHWIKSKKVVNGLKDYVDKGEYYTFQVGMYSPTQNLSNITVEFSDLHKGNRYISKELITCFNESGIDLNGKSFEKVINVEKGEMQALWCGVEIPKDVSQGNYKGYCIVKPGTLPADTVFLSLYVSSDIIENYGDNEPSNMSRLRWLNSTIGTDPEFIVQPFEPVKIEDKVMNVLGREIELSKTGLPQRISSFFTQEMTKLTDVKEEVLAQPVRFVIKNTTGELENWNSSPFSVEQQYSSEAAWVATSSSDHFTMNVSGKLEYDGMLDYKILLIAQSDINVEDIQLQIPMEKDVAEYILGLGFKGGKRQNSITWKWDVTNHHEGVWLGTINKGLQFVLRDENYERPLNTNFYQNKPLNLPPSWYNKGKGGINIHAKEEYIAVENYSGAREIKSGDTLNFNIRILITPFKLIDTKEHFNTRFVHKYVPVDSVVAWKGTVVNVHHANEINPYINYPFYNVDMQKAYIDEAHSKGVKVKLYNTIRELTYKSYELFAMKSLGTEIFNDGEGGGHTWLQEHFKANYHSAWHATSVNDASILNKGNSRWTNYYIEGINWLAKNQQIDGLYLDDIAFSRTTVKRIASVLSAHREKYVIDLHSANQYNTRDGFINSAFLYMEHFPYVQRLWFGEYFEYDLDPDYWLTEVSGIPFGLTGEMLQDGGHPYRGLVYGMTTRVYGKYSPKAIWKLFDDFDIANSEMLGYWVDRSPIKTNSKDIRSSVYVLPDKVLIAIGSWSDKDEKVELKIRWDKLEIKKENAVLVSPKMEGMQGFKTYDLNAPVIVPKEEGIILLLSKNQ